MALFIKIENGKTIGHPLVRSNLEALLPEVDFPAIVLPGWPEQYGYSIYEFSQIPEITERYKKAVEVEPTKSNGVYKQTWAIVDMTDEEKILADQQKSQQMRNERDIKLYETEWMISRHQEELLMERQPTLSQQDLTALLEYRQKLRDISSLPGFPWDFEWPTAPNA